MATHTHTGAPIGSPASRRRAERRERMGKMGPTQPSRHERHEAARPGKRLQRAHLENAMNATGRKKLKPRRGSGLSLTEARRQAVVEEFLRHTNG